MNEVVKIVVACSAWIALCGLACVLFYVLPIAVDRAEKRAAKNGGAR